MKWYDILILTAGVGLIHIGFIALNMNAKPNKPAMTCYSPHDVYKVYDYEIADDNTTLITSHGRIYHMSECTKDK